MKPDTATSKAEDHLRRHIADAIDQAIYIEVAAVREISKQFSSRKSIGVMKQIRFFVGPSAKIEPYCSDSTPPKQ